VAREWFGEGIGDRRDVRRVAWEVGVVMQASSKWQGKEHGRGRVELIEERLETEWTWVARADCRLSGCWSWCLRGEPGVDIDLASASCAIVGPGGGVVLVMRLGRLLVAARVESPTTAVDFFPTTAQSAESPKATSSGFRAGF
jgi:hypothetical protein